MPGENVLQRALRRFTSSNAELESEDLQRTVREEGAVPIMTCEDRQQVQLTGTISTVTINPRGGHPALEVELHFREGMPRDEQIRRPIGDDKQHAERVETICEIGDQIDRGCVSPMHIFQEEH